MYVVLMGGLGLVGTVGIGLAAYLGVGFGMPAPKQHGIPEWARVPSSTPSGE